MKRQILILGAGLIGLVMVLALVIAWGDTGGTQTARADGPTPVLPEVTPKGPANGTCSYVGQVTYKNKLRQHWNCVQTVADPFDRVQIYVGKVDQAWKLDYKNPPLFACKNPVQQVKGEAKGHLKELNTPPLINEEVWSGDFKYKCVGNPAGQVQVYLVGLSNPNPTIKEVFFSNSGQGAITGNLSAIYDITVPLTETIGLYTCIARLDHFVESDELKVAAICNSEQDIGDPNNPLPDLEGEGPPGDDGAAGPPPPPPYTTLAPAKLNGSYDDGADSITLRGCFEDIGGILGPNILVAVVIPTAKAQLASTGEMTGALYLYPNADARKLPGPYIPGSQCATKVPTGDQPDPLTMTLHNIKTNPGMVPWRKSLPDSDPGKGLPWRQDFDGDDCTDFQELDKTRAYKCGDDPYNPHDSGNKMDDISGAYSMVAIAVYENWNKDLDEVQPGVYYNCLADLQQTGDGKTDGDIVARLLCYIDNPNLPVNPEGGTEGGNGSPGAAPPPPYADVDQKHTELTGYIDNDKNTLELAGCFQDTDGQGSLGYVYVETEGLDVHTLQGTVLIWSFSDASNCTNGTPKGDPTRADLRLARQSNKDETERDTDGDGCPDKSELTNDERTGGLRDPFNKWDYFNPTNDGRNRIDDVLAVIANYRADDPPDTNKYDRTAVAGSNDWNAGPPNGTIRIADVLAAIFQYRHDCGEGDVWPPKPTPWE